MTDKKTSYLILLIAVVILAAGCIIQSVKGPGSQKCEKQLFAMDTYMTFEAYGKNAEKAVDAAIEEVKRLDALLSTGSASSEVYRINSNGGGRVSEDTKVLIERSYGYYESTEGLFDITIYPLMELWGFTSKNYHVPTASELKAVLGSVDAGMLDFDGEMLTLKDGQKIDFGGIAKGYTSARVMEIFEEYGVENGMISLGGNIQTMGKNESGQPWNIGIRDPKGDANDALGAVKVSGKAVVTSGGYERYFEEDGNTYIHILNPKTGQPADEDLVSVTIVSEDGTLADAMSTSIYLMGLEKASDYWRAHADEFEMILITEDGRIHATEGISGSFNCIRDYQVIARAEV